MTQAMPVATNDASEVDLYFDFVSPYTYLLLAQADAFAQRNKVAWRLQPVVYGVLLNHTGLVGPVEVEVKRRYSFADIRRCAALLDIPLVGAPAHPFRSLEALRTVCLYLDDPRCLDLTVALAHACWGAGRDLADADTLAAVVASSGLEASNLEARLAADDSKHRLRETTSRAIDRGVFGVPTCRLGDELFWGHDRLPHLAARIAGRIPDPLEGIDQLLERPRAAERRAGAPSR